MTAVPPGAPPPKAYITFSTGVSDTSTNNLLTILGNCASQGIPEVHLLLSTNGGSIMCGVNIYNVLCGMPFKLVTHNVGNVDSIGNAIFLAGQDRFACASATFMFHGVGFTANGMAFDIRTVQERLKSLKADETRLVNIVAQHTDMSVQKIRRLYQGSRTMSATEAQQVGIVHGIQNVNIPQGSVVVTVTG